MSSNEMIAVPYQELSAEALQGLLEDFVTRQGYDTTGVDQGLQDWVLQVKQQLIKGQLVIVYDPVSQTVTVLTCQEYKIRQQHMGFSA